MDDTETDPQVLRLAANLNLKPCGSCGLYYSDAKSHEAVWKHPVEKRKDQ